jgi:hypothetical protein
MSTVSTEPRDWSTAVNSAIGLAGVIVGLVGIYLTVLSSPVALDAIGTAVSGSGLPEQFKGLSGFITIFSVIRLILLSFIFLFIGLVASLSMLFKVLGMKRWEFGAIWVVLWLFHNAFFLSIGAIFGPTAGWSIVTGFILAMIMWWSHYGFPAPS